MIFENVDCLSEILSGKLLCAEKVIVAGDIELDLLNACWSRTDDSGDGGIFESIT